MYATDRQTDVRQKYRLMPPPIRSGSTINDGNVTIAFPILALTVFIRLT